MTIYIKKINPILLDMEKYKKLYYNLFVILFLLNSLTLFSQNHLDKLKEKSLSELFSLYQKASLKKEKIEYIKAFINVAKKEKKKKRILAGYYILSSFSVDEQKLMYCDSIINLTKNNPIQNHPSAAYNVKAIFYESKGYYEKALDNYLLSNKFAANENNMQLFFLNIYSIASIKRIIGEYDEAKILFKQSLNYFKTNENNINYLNSIIGLSNLSYELKEIDSATYYNKLGAHESLIFKDLEKYHHFATNQGIIHFINGENEIALDSINKHKFYFFKNKDSINLSYVHFYLGKIYDSKGLKKLATKHHKKIDSLLNFKLDLTPKFRESYEFLINQYKQDKDLKNQLFYIKKLMDFDSVINSKENYLSKTIFKEYDIPKLNSEKLSIQKKMKDDKTIFKNIIITFSIILITSIFFLIYQFQKKKLYKKRFLEIIQNSKNKNKNKNDLNKIDENSDIPEEIIKEVLEELKKFEKSNKFLNKTITLNSLAKDFNTNTNYLSKIINKYKKTSFSNYINNLKIEYIISEIKRNPNLKKYTIKAIADEAYFNNSESFSKAFYKLKGIKPSYFFRELSNLKGNN